MNITLYDIINSISATPEIEFSREDIERYYNPYVTMLFFSNFEDTIFVVNELNCMKKQLEKYDHYLFLKGTIRKRNRRSIPPKKNKIIEENIKYVMEYFDYSREKAKEAMKILSDINIEEIKSYLNNKGGIIKK